MLRIFIWKELTEHLLTVRFLVCLLLCLTLGATSLTVLMLQYGMLNSEARHESLRHRLELDGVSVDEVRWRGFYVDRESPSLRVFHVGLDDMLSRSVSNSLIWGRRYESALSANPVFLLFPILDTTYVVGVVMSLMAFVLCYDAVSGELERGTMALTLSFPVPRDVIILGKWIGAVLAAGIPLLITILAAVILVVGFAGIRLTGLDWGALAATSVAALMYLGLACALALWVSALVRNSATSIALLLLIWVMGAVVVPNLSPYLAEVFAPIPSVQSVESEKSEARRGVMDEYFPKFRDVWRIRDAQERQKRIADLQRDITRRITAEQDRIDSAFQRRLESQTQWAQAISRLSPYASFVYAVTSLADTGIEARGRFFDAVHRHERQFLGYVDEVMRANERLGIDGWEDAAEKIDLRAMPVFAPARASLSERLAEASVDYLALGLGTVLFGLLAHRRFVRLRLR